MATSREQQTLDIQAFPCYTKRKLDTEESSMSLVYENGIFSPRSEKRQRLNGNYSEIEAQSLEENKLTFAANANDMNLNASREQNMEEDSEMMEQTIYSNNMEGDSTQVVNGGEIFNGVLNEPQTGITKTTTNGICHDHVNLPRTRTINCTVPSVNSFCFQGGLLDNMLVHYHGL